MTLITTPINAAPVTAGGDSGAVKDIKAVAIHDAYFGASARSGETTFAGVVQRLNALLLGTTTPQIPCNGPWGVAGLGYNLLNNPPAAAQAYMADAQQFVATPDRAFTDTAGTVPATWGNTVARINAWDNSVTPLQPASQSNAALRGTLGRAPFDAAPGGAIDQGSGPAFIRLDLVDDVIPWTAPDGLSGDVLVIGRSGSWIERDVTVAAGGTLSIGPTTIAGRVPGIVRAVGDIVAIVPIDRTMTEVELARMIAYYRPLGGTGLLTLGAELVTNGTFASDVSGWTVSSATAASVSGQAVLTQSAGSGQTGILAQQIATTPGAFYLLSLDIVARNASGGFGVSNTGLTTTAREIVDALHSSVGTHERVFQATAATTVVKLFTGTIIEGQSTTFDNVSVRPLTAS